MKIKVKDMILIGVFAALTAVGAFIQVPFGTVPFTLQFLFTALAGVMLGARLGALSQLTYVLIGLFGAPVFAGGVGGFSTIGSKTFGYLIGFILGAYVIGKISEESYKPSAIRLFMATLCGMAVIYLVGVPYLYLIIRLAIGKSISFYAVLKAGFFIFIPGDLLKCAITALLGAKIVPVLRKTSSL